MRFQSPLLRSTNIRKRFDKGVRYGLAMALFAPLPTYMICYAVQPLPADMVIKQIIGDGLLVIALAVLVAFLNKPASNVS